MVQLKVYDGQEKVEVLELKQEIVSVGRDQGNTLVLPDGSVSRLHAHIEPRGNFYLIRDHASTNGTFVNEMLVRLQILGHGDTIRIGKYLIRVDTSHSTSCEMTQVRVEQLEIPTGLGLDPQCRTPTPGIRSKGDRRANTPQSLTRLHKIYREIGHVDTTDSLVERALDIILKELDADRGSFLLFPDTTSTAEDHEDGAREAIAPAPETVVVRTRPAGSAGADELVIPREFLQETCRNDECVGFTVSAGLSRLACALRDKSTLKAVVYIERRGQHAPFTADDRQFLTALSSQIAISLTNAQLFAETGAVQEKIKEIFTSLTDGVLVTDTDFRILEANTAATVLLEVDNKNVLGKTLPELLEKFDVTPAMDVVRASAFRTMGIFRIIAKTKKRDPETNDRVRAATITPFPRDAATPRGFVVILRDRSDSWRTEQLKSRFIENVAHKLRRPLAVIRANLPLLREGSGEGSSSHAALLDEIDRNSTILCRIVDRFVEFTDMEWAHDLSPTTSGSVSLKETIRDVVLSKRDEADAKGVTVVERIEADLPLIAGDQGRISTALANILDNAIKFSGDTDRVLIEGSSDPNYVRVVVSDDGPGISPTEVESVFHIGHQIDADKTNQMSGAGLGLVFARHIVQEHGGEVTITSPTAGSDHGTSVAVLLPQFTPEAVHSNPEGIAGQLSFNPSVTDKEPAL